MKSTFAMLSVVLATFLSNPMAHAAAVASPAVAKAKPAADPLKALSRKYDKMGGVAWYQSTSAPKYRNTNGMYLYFGKFDSGTITPLRLAVQYASDDWLFITKAFAKADKTRIDFPQESGFSGWERDNGSGGIWEWSDVPVTGASDIAAVRAMAEAKSVTVRYEGKQYYNDRNLSAKQLKGMREVIAAYEAETKRPWK